MREAAARGPLSYISASDSLTARLDGHIKTQVCRALRISPKRSVGGYREESDRFFAALVFPAKTHFVKAKKALAMLSKNSG